MESQYEDQSPAAKSGTHNAFIDFYRQGDSNNPHGQLDTQMFTTQREVYEDINSLGNGGSVLGGIAGLGFVSGAVAVGSDNLIFRSDYNGLDYSSNNQNKRLLNPLMKSDQHLETRIKQINHDKQKEDYKRMMQDNKAVGLKRRSVENSEALTNNQNNRQNEGSRQFNTAGTSGAKSAMSNYPGALSNNQQQQQQQTGVISSGSQQLKQINKNKIERDLIMENVIYANGVSGSSGHQQQHFQNSNSIAQQQQMTLQQQKRSLAKSQSQNRLLLVAHENIMNKGKPYADSNEGNTQDKNSFSDQSLGRVGNVPQDLLYKQHHLYSSNNQTQQKSWHLKAHNSNNFLSQLSTTKECTYCNKTGGVHSADQCSAIYCIKDSLGMMIQNNLSKKYSTNRDYYNLKIVNDLIYNENTHIVSIFKDYLILDDINEFLKRSYTYSETKVRLPKLCSFYDKYSQVFPNYVILPESKYMFKNIQRKQKLIDEQYQIQEELAKKAHQTLLDEDKLFNSNFYNSVYRMDLSMSRQQYEDQAKSIASIAGKSQRPTRIDQMKIDELVDRFLMKDSESNIQLITTAGLDFSGFTHQSTFINDTGKISITPNKLGNLPAKNKVNPSAMTGKQSIGQTQPTQQQQKSTIQMLQPKSQPSQSQNNAAVGQRKESALNSKRNTASMQSNALNSNNASGGIRRQKGSFNNNQLQQQVQQNKGLNNPKIDTNKPVLSSNNNNMSSSTKTTPRLQKTAAYTITSEEATSQKQQVQTSPATKEALSNYLHNCQIEGGITPQNQEQMLSIQILEQMESSQLLQSPQFIGGKLLAQSSQTALSQQLPSNSLVGGNRQLMKSQCVIPTIQLGQGAKEITNLKKTTRLSGGHQNKPTPQNKKAAVSPMPLNQNLQQQNFTASSRNIVSTSSQKSIKSVNSHAKYLSGGNDQYQRLLQQQNPFASHENIVTQQNEYGSSTKKMQAQQNTISKQDLITMDDRGNILHSKKVLNPDEIDNEVGLITGEDCDEAGIADERFASPDVIFGSTTDEMLGGRKSIQGRHNMNPVVGGFGQQPILLTSTEDNRILSQCNNYDQIKKHLEQFITVNGGNNKESLNQHNPQNQLVGENGSNTKKYAATMSSEKMQYELELQQQQTGYNKNQLAQSASASNNNNDSNNSRNSTAQKHFESLKQKIRGAFDGGSGQESVKKTPNKSSTHSKKAQGSQQQQQQQMINNQQQPTFLQQNRMSIESRDNMMLIAQAHIPGSMSSTSAAGRTLSFGQFSSSQQQNNYRSITNGQHRKNSSQKHENSADNKRLSQNRQSFKEISQSQNNNDKIKRSATGKTLSINDINQHTFGTITNQGLGQQNYLQHISSTTTLSNPTFISSKSKAYQTHHHQQSSLNGGASQSNLNNNSQSQAQAVANSQQAANTVRVMTPSYSLASLSKLISPTTSTSPITMTVTLASHQASRKQVNNHQRKQQILANSNSNAQLQISNQQQLLQMSGSNANYQNNPSSLMASTSPSVLDRGLASDKSKIIGAASKQHQIQAQAKQSRTLGGSGNAAITANAQLQQQQQQQQMYMNNQQQYKSGQLQQKTLQNRLQGSSSQETFQVTPRGMPLQMMQKAGGTMENSQNISCTISTENNNSSNIIDSISQCTIAAKAVESKNPKFMRTIEEYSQNTQQQQQQQLSSSGGAMAYNNMLSASMGHRKSGTGLSGSISQAQLDLKQRQKIQTVVNSNQGTIKRTHNGGGASSSLGGTMSISASVSHFKSPSQQIQAKKSIHGRYI